MPPPDLTTAELLQYAEALQAAAAKGLTQSRASDAKLQEIEQQIENLEGGPGPTTIAEGMPGPEADKYISSLLSPTGGPPPSFLNPPSAPSLSPEEQQNLGRLSGGVPPPEARALQLGVGDLTDEAIQKYIDELNASVDKAEVDAELSNLAGVSYIPTSLTPPSPVPEAPTLPDPVPEAPTLPSPGGGGGIPSLNIDLPGVGDSLARGNESGILGTPQEEILGGGFHTGPPIGEDLQTAIRDQARAAEDAEAGLLPSEDQVRDAFLGSLRRGDGDGSTLSTIKDVSNVASGIATLAKAAGKSLPPAIVWAQLANTLSGIHAIPGQSEWDELTIKDPTLIGTGLRAFLPGWAEKGLGFFGLSPSVSKKEMLRPTTGLSPFHPTPEQSEQLTAPVTLPPKVEDVTTESLPAPTDFVGAFSQSQAQGADPFGGFTGEEFYNKGGIVTL